MTYFIALGQFSVENSSLTKVLGEPMRLGKGKAVRWAQWHADPAGPDSRPDATLMVSRHDAHASPCTAVSHHASRTGTRNHERVDGFRLTRKVLPLCPAHTNTNC